MLFPRIEDLIVYEELNNEEKKVVKEIMKILDGMTEYQINHVLDAVKGGVTISAKVTLPKDF